MSKTLELRALIQRILFGICANSGYERATDEKMYPHITFDLSSVNLADLSRDDLFLDIDIWDRGNSSARADELTDQVEAAFYDKNLPQDAILPTFYRSSRKKTTDPDPLIHHRTVTIQIQNYEVK